MKEMLVFEQEIELKVDAADRHLLNCLEDAITARLGENAVPIRFAITHSDRPNYHCELAVLSCAKHWSRSVRGNGFPSPG